MEPIGWVIFILSNLAVIALVAFCFYRVLTLHEGHMHAPLEIDTKDLHDNDTDDDDEF
jgi:hypothetical protein